MFWGLFSLRCRRMIHLWPYFQPFWLCWGKRLTAHQTTRTVREKRERKRMIGNENTHCIKRHKLNTTSLYSSFVCQEKLSRMGVERAKEFLGFGIRDCVINVVHGEILFIYVWWFAHWGWQTTWLTQSRKWTTSIPSLVTSKPTIYLWTLAILRRDTHWLAMDHMVFLLELYWLQLILWQECRIAQDIGAATYGWSYQTWCDFEQLHYQEQETWFNCGEWICFEVLPGSRTDLLH